MNVEQLLVKKKIEFQLQGQDFLVSCLNPEHPDVHPSMRINQITGIFNCFSCGFKGNIFSHFEEKPNFLQQKRETLRNKIRRKLAENIGLEIPKDAIRFHRDWRGIRGSTFAAFEAFEHHRPDFVGRVVFPIKSLAGRVIGFNGRALTPDREPRYLIYPAGSRFPLYPAKITPIYGRVAIVEGIFDMLNLHDKGLTNAVCSMGTQTVTVEKLQLLKIQGVNGIDIMLDNDDAGKAATLKIEELANKIELETKKITGLGSKDPGELTAQQVMRLGETLYG